MNSSPSPTPHPEMRLKQQEEHKKDGMVSSIGLLGSTLIFILMLIWIVSGAIAFVMSIICFFYDSTMDQKIIGLLLAILLGPFYWFYYIYNTSYCNKYQ
jgi:hypothetical protein